MNLEEGLAAESAALSSISWKSYDCFDCTVIEHATGVQYLVPVPGTVLSTRYLVLLVLVNNKTRDTLNVERHRPSRSARPMRDVREYHHHLSSSIQ